MTYKIGGKSLSRRDKAKALYDSGEATSMKDAYVQLEDMGE